ncbi:CBM35 domain-containing protein [Streptomyces sp. bgisy091]|uniref:CBM35 domain-containing protein n=1 Tax=Streptomyces sp. bgisy091 TaxID=3413778 RepID=UPI003D71507B
MRRTTLRRRALPSGTRAALAALTSAAALAACVTAVPQAGAAPSAAAAADVITIDTGASQGALRKPGLGSLFGVASLPDTPKDLITRSQTSLAQHQSPDGDASFPTNTEAVAAKLDGTGVRMVARFNDMMGGWPYEWKSLDDWLTKVASGTRSIQKYRNLVYAVAPLNEPDNKLQGAFMNDPALPAGSYDSKVNYVWTRSVRAIRAIDPTVPVMGPNYEHYNPWESADRQPRMRDFLRNAIDTGTVPDMIGWHSLGPSPGDVPETLTKYYRPLEKELGVPGAPLPVVVEEYGPGSDDFEGVPGTMVKHWAEFARYGIDYATMGVYNGGGLLGNTLRRVQGGAPAPNGGFWFQQWYKSMTGNQIAVSRWDTRHYQAADGVAAWDAGKRTMTALLGGDSGDQDIRVRGLAARGLGPEVQVRLEYTDWTKDPTDADPRIESGGDPQSGTYTLFDKRMTLDASGDLTVPVRAMDKYDGYRLTVTTPGTAQLPSTTYEAEGGALTGAVLHTGADARYLASGNAYVGGIDGANSSVALTVNAPDTGVYAMRVRYANGGTGAATHRVTVGGRAQGEVSYPATGGWLDSTSGIATERVLLAKGANTLTLTKGTGNAELDWVDLRPDTHRYEAESATVTAARRSNYFNDYVPGYVGGIDAATSAVTFAVDAPAAGTYRLTVGYANATASPATHDVSVGGTSRATAAYGTTSDWLSSRQQDRVEKTTTVDVPLSAGVNQVRFQKRTGNAELDFITVAPSP